MIEAILKIIKKIHYNNLKTKILNAEVTKLGLKLHYNEKLIVNK